MEKRPVILNFSGVYEQVRFWEEGEEIFLDLKGISGTNGYCDSAAGQELSEMFRKLGPSGIHFLDSGNYHYVTKLWTDLIGEPFDLLVFDHHTDMQLPAFGGILSCGGWLRLALEENAMLKQVCLVGPPREAAVQDGLEEWGERLVFVPEDEMEAFSWEGFFAGRTLPLYLSVDKDVLRKEDAAVNWDQGKADLAQVLKVLKTACAARPVVGADLCGEDPGGMEEVRALQKAKLLNEKLLRSLERWIPG